MTGCNNILFEMNTSPPDSPDHATSSKMNRIFAITVLLYQALMCFLFGFLYGFKKDFFNSQQDYGGMLLVSILTLFLLVGMGLVNSYVTHSAVTGMSYTLLIYVLTIQTFFIFRAFWNKAGVNDEIDSSNTFSQDYSIVTLSNYMTDRQKSTDLPSAAFVEAVACAISTNVAVSPVLGRIGLLQVFFFTVFGTLFYELNAQLMWRWFVTDTGYGYRIFIFGSLFGIFPCLFLKNKIYRHQHYFSKYTYRAFGMLGFLILWCGFPLLAVAGIFTRTQEDILILYASPVNMWLALSAGVLGTFVVSAGTYRKFSVHDLIFSGLTGGIIFSSSSDVNWNPSVPLIVGFLVSLATSFKASSLHRKTIENGVISSYLHITRFLVPGLVAAILVAVLHAVGRSSNGSYSENLYRDIDSPTMQGRTPVGQGAFMILAIVVTSVFAALAGVSVGILCYCVNKYSEAQQYNDEMVYSGTPVHDE